MTCSGKKCCSAQDDNEKIVFDNANRMVSIDIEFQSVMLDTRHARPTDHDTCILKIRGTDCAGCANEVSNALARVPGIVHHTVNYITSQAKIEYAISITTSDLIIQAIQSCGYSCSVSTSDDDAAVLEGLRRTDETNLLMRRFWISIACSGPLFALSWITKLVPEMKTYRIYDGLFLLDLMSLLLAGMLIYISRNVFIVAFNGLRRRLTSLDLLIVVGISAAFIYSGLAISVSVFTSGDVRPKLMFDAIGELVSITLLGRWLESRVSCRTSQALASLLKLVPLTAIKIVEQAQELITSESLVHGDMVMIQPGCAVPADCTVVHGESSVDESSFTGDNISVARSPGDLIYAGTVNRTSSLTCRVLRSGQDTRLSRISRMLVDAQVQRASIQVMADRLAVVLIRSILFLSLTTLCMWLYLDPSKYVESLGEETGRVLLSLKLAIAVLVITCPCALSVATPAAVMVGTGTASKRGMLIKGAPALEKLVAVTDVVFDKTGTLTTGIMTVKEVCWHLPSPLSDSEKQELLHVLAAAEHKLASVHPIATAIIAYAQTQSLLAADRASQIKDLSNLSGQGFSCHVRLGRSSDTRMVVAGSTSLLQGLKLLQRNDAVQATTSISPVMHVVLDNALCCTIHFKDDIRPESLITITHLTGMKKTVWLLTGDHVHAAKHVAKALGITDDHIISSATPESKAETIRKLQRQGRVIAFCGDGINDALALATADVGYSLTGATDVAIASADVILDGSNRLYKIIVSLALAKDVFRRIKMNLYTAMAWNVIMVPFAMGSFLPWHVYIPPLLACMAMSLSCISMIASSLWLKRWTHSSDESNHMQDASTEHRDTVCPTKWFRTRSQYTAVALAEKV